MKMKGMIRTNTVPFDWSIAEKLGLKHTHPEVGVPYFTGWKCAPNPYQPGTNLGAVGQIVMWLADKEGEVCRFLYVNLPGFQSGILDAGLPLNIGTERVPILGELPKARAEDLLRGGLKKLLSLKEDIDNEV